MEQTQKVAGYIGYWGLSDWWLSTFSEEERSYIKYKVRTMRAGPNALTEGTPFIITNSTHNNVSFFLVNLVNWFREPKDNSIARRIAMKALELAEEVEDISYSLSWIIRLYYQVRDNEPGALELVENSCKRYIAITPLIVENRIQRYQREYPNLPTEKYIPLSKHEGYNYYVIILEKRKEYAEVIRLCGEAKAQGWAGDWDKRIHRCSKRLVKKV